MTGFQGQLNRKLNSIVVARQHCSDCYISFNFFVCLLLKITMNVLKFNHDSVVHWLKQSFNNLVKAIWITSMALWPTLATPVKMSWTYQWPPPHQPADVPVFKMCLNLGSKVTFSCCNVLAACVLHWHKKDRWHISTSSYTNEAKYPEWEHSHLVQVTSSGATG